MTVGGSNQIVKGPDERDEIPIDVGQQNHQVVNEDAIDAAISVPTNESEEKSERVLRHAIQSRTDDQSDTDDSTDIVSTTTNVVNDESADNSLPATIPPTTVSTETITETATTTLAPESSSTIANNEKHSTATPVPSEWLGYYDFGIHKPEFIQKIEFTTDYPSQSVREDIRYVTYETPFKASLPDYSSAYASNFFVPLKYFKR